MEKSLINGKLDINNDLVYKNAYLEKSLINGKLDINNDVVYKNAYWEKNINYDLDKSIVIVNNSPQRIVFSDDVVSRLAVSSGHSSSIDDGTQIGGHGQIGGRDTQIGGQSDHIGGHGGQSHNSTNINVLYVQFQDDADTGGQSHTDDGGQSQTDDGGSPIHSNIGGQTVDGRSHTQMVDNQLVDILTYMVVVVALMVYLPWIQITSWMKSGIWTTTLRISEEEEGEDSVPNDSSDGQVMDLLGPRLEKMMTQVSE